MAKARKSARKTATRKAATRKKTPARKKAPAGKKTPAAKKKSGSSRAPRVVPNDDAWRALIETAIEKPDPQGAAPTRQGAKKK